LGSVFLILRFGLYWGRGGLLWFSAAAVFTQLAQGDLEVGWGGGFEGEGFTCGGVEEAQVAGMEEDHVWGVEGFFGVAGVGLIAGVEGREVERLPLVESVIDDGVLVISEVDPHLVGAAGYGDA